jgi:segregation and condensation protein B
VEAQAPSDEGPLEDPTPPDVPVEVEVEVEDAQEADRPLEDPTPPDVPVEVAPVPDEGPDPADGPSLRAAIEAVLLVVDTPVAEVTLAQVCERPREEVLATLHALAAEYDAGGRGIALREVAGGWRFYTRPECAAVVERFVLDGQQARLTQAALETLAVVAYRHPVSRARVSAVRGVNVDGVMRTLVARGLVEEGGTESESGATLFRTTSYFLERLGLRSLDELPDLAPFLPSVDSLDGDIDLPTS